MINFNPFFSRSFPCVMPTLVYYIEMRSKRDVFWLFCLLFDWCGLEETQNFLERCLDRVAFTLFAKIVAQSIVTDIGQCSSLWKKEGSHADISFSSMTTLNKWWIPSQLQHVLNVNSHRSVPLCSPPYKWYVLQRSGPKRNIAKLDFFFSGDVFWILPW